LSLRLPVAGHWYQSRNFEGGVVLVWEPHVHPFARCNIWLVRGEERDLLIDSGTGVLPLTPHLPMVKDRPLIAVATHGHFDHIGALHEFADRRAHGDEADEYAEMPDAMTLAPLFRQLEAPVDARPYESWSPEHYRVAPAPIAARLAEGDRIDLGRRSLTVLHLPGHSPGSIGFFDERNGILFSGDALYDGELIDDFPRSDVEHYRATMQRLRALPIHVGHGAVFERAGNLTQACLLDGAGMGERGVDAKPDECRCRQVAPVRLCGRAPAEPAGKRRGGEHVTRVRA
jgi:glyoxylase-like metal-dependent hydrolase (beta-lactamase superfamily II)